MYEKVNLGTFRIFSQYIVKEANIRIGNQNRVKSLKKIVFEQKIKMPKKK